jgi:hypothetical protein
MGTVQNADDFLIFVDDLDGPRVYPVESFQIDTRLARLVPVFNDGKRPRDLSHFATFRLVSPETSPKWLYEAIKSAYEDKVVMAHLEELLDT